VRVRSREAAVGLVALFGLGAAAGCTGYSGTLGHQVSQWASQYTVISNDLTVVADIDAIKRSLAAGRLKDVTSNCAGLVDDAGTAYGNLPTPDNTLTNELNIAYEDFASAGSSCATAATVDSPKIPAALAKIGKGLVVLSKATRRLAADGVH
jgi:hypothetical protein